MSILVVAQVENAVNIDQQINKQTMQPDQRFIMVDADPANTIELRRKRIAENHQELVDAVRKIQPDIVWQLEGDVVLPDDCLERMIETMARHDMDYLSGVQVGRHGIYCIGAWHVDPERLWFASVDHNQTGVQPIDATGFYCILAKRETWLSGKAEWSGEPYGPDVNWGLSIPGYKYVDMDLHIGHKTKRGIINVTDASTCNVRFEKNGTEWEYKQLD